MKKEELVEGINTVTFISEEQNGIEEVAENIDEISEDIIDIGKDTDKLLMHMVDTLKELSENSKQTVSTKKWVIALFIIDKLVMLGVIILGLKLGGL